MTIGECLRGHVFSLAEGMNLPVAFAGEPFVAPGGPWLACSVGNIREKAAGIGKNAPLRIDGSLEIAVMALAGGDIEQAGCLAARVAAAFPHGFGLECQTPLGSGEIVFAAPVTCEAATDGGRIRIEVRIGFYAILFREDQAWQK